MIRKHVRLGDVLEVQSGFAFKTEFFTQNEGVPLIRIRDLPNADTKINYCGPFRDDFLVLNGDYLIGMDGTFECYRWKGGRALLNQRVCRLRNFHHTIDPEYVYFGIQRELREIENTTAFVTVKHISAGQIANINFPCPPLPEQRRIVDILYRAESIVRLRREAQKKAAELIPALFTDLFGDPVTNPKGWPIQRLDNVSQVISGATKGRRLTPNQAIELPYMRVANVKDGHLDLTEVKTIQIKRTEVERLKLEIGDLLMTEGGDPDKLGRAALWAGEVDLCVHQNHIFKVRSDRAQVLPEYLRALVGSAYGKDHFLRIAKKTTGIASINKTQLSAFPVVLPPLDKQRTFVAHVATMESIQIQQATATTQADATFNALLAQVFSDT